MSCGYWLRVNNYWLPIEGVQSGVGYGFERARSGFSSVGGVAHAQEALRATRTWSVNFGELVGPETVAALKMAAQQDAGDVMLWDESTARENLLDPVSVGARDGYPVMLCDGMPVISLTSASGETAPTVTEDVALKANLTAFSGGTSSRLAAGDGQDLLLKVSIPPTPVGRVLVGAALILTGTGTSAMDAYAASNSWAEPTGGTSTADYYTSVPAGVLVSSASPVGGVWTFDMDAPTAFEGSDMSLRIVGDAVAVNEIVSRTAATAAPILRLTYSVTPEPRVVRQHLRAGSYWLTYWTNATEGTQVGTLEADGATQPIVTGAGLGLRRTSVDLSAVTADADRDWTITILDSSTYLLGGLMLTSLPADHYLPGEKTPVRVTVDDPSLTLGSLYSGERGKGQRGTTIREVG